ncbi:MAG: hypothetical protein EON89_06300 [Brevundimonas sp.]|nr:MAG: hypothetical protein EON89_06300 [Brevundimonas sp.]
MRGILTTLSLSAALAVGACASGAPAEGSYLSRDQKLAEDCRARGGILAPSGQTTGRPEVDSICRISGPAPRAGADR